MATVPTRGDKPQTSLQLHWQPDVFHLDPLHLDSPRVGGLVECQLKYPSGLKRSPKYLHLVGDVLSVGEHLGQGPRSQDIPESGLGE